MVASILVRFGHNPSRSIRDALPVVRVNECQNQNKYEDAHEIQDLPLLHQHMQTVHDFFDRGVPVPPVHIQNVDVRSPELL